jgi:hypothetical protein
MVSSSRLEVVQQLNKSPHLSFGVETQALPLIFDFSGSRLRETMSVTVE